MSNKKPVILWVVQGYLLLIILSLVVVAIPNIAGLISGKLGLLIAQLAHVLFTSVVAIAAFIGISRRRPSGYFMTILLLIYHFLVLLYLALTQSGSEYERVVSVFITVGLLTFGSMVLMSSQSRSYLGCPNKHRQ